MNCPFCGHPDSRVIDSRPDAAGIRRRRECQACSRRFTTLEKVELGGVAVIKKDDSREEFDREKIVAGVRKACEKRPIPSGAVEALADELVMERLRALDHIAYIRFASVYRAFADVEELERELEALKAGWRRPDIPDGQLAMLPEAEAKAAKPRLLRVRRPRGEEGSGKGEEEEPPERRRAQ